MNIQKFKKLPKEKQQAFFDSLTDEERAELLYNWKFWARPSQLAPSGDWDVWLALAGRGWGKTKTGSEWIRDNVDAGNFKRIALIAETAADCRDVIVEGESGILSCYPNKGEGIVEYFPSKRQIVWKNGAIAHLFNATEPAQLRGPQFDAAWCDELAKWRYARETWDMLQFGLRLGKHPKALVTTTPRPIEIVKAIMAGKEGKVHVTKGSTMDNVDNLAAPFLSRIQKRYEGTRLGRQELSAEILSDIPNALWSYATIDVARVSEVPDDLSSIVVAIDPAVTSTEKSDEHGIIVVALSNDGKEAYVIEDGSIKGGPLQWARRAVTLYDKFQADNIVVEVNQGGDMVKQTIEAVRSGLPVREVRATRGKHVRAEPISALYEQGRVHHVGTFDELEKQMTMMTSAGYEDEGSPDRLDALVWGLTALFPDIVGAPKGRVTLNFSGRLHR